MKTEALANTRFLNVADFAARLGVKQVTVRVWAAQRKITTTKLGRCLRIPESEIERLVNEGLRPARQNW